MENEQKAEVNQAEQIVAAIREISEMAQKFNRSALKRDTIVTLIHAHTKVSKRDIEKVFHHLTRFDTIHLGEGLKTTYSPLLEGLMVDKRPE